MCSSDLSNISFSNSLENLHTKRYHRKETGNRDLKEMLEALKQVEVFGRYLKMMVRSSAIETHLQTIAQFLVVDTKKLWTFEPEEDVDFADFHPLNPYSMHKGKALLPWELYRDWLRLMVHYFDAAKVFTSFFGSLELCHLPMPTISITILSPPLPDHKMLTWTELLGTERFFPIVPGGLSGKDFIEFLQTSDSYKDSPTHKNVKDVIESAQRLIKKLKLDPLILDILTKIDTFAQEVKKKCASTDWHNVIEAILALKDSQPLDQLVKMQAIGDMIGTLSKKCLVL